MRTEKAEFEIRKAENLTKRILAYRWLLLIAAIVVVLDQAAKAWIVARFPSGAYGELGAVILAVVSNHDNLRPLAEKFSVPFHHVPHAGLGREEHERLLQALLGPMAPDYIVLAKYMRILSPAFDSLWPNRIVNIHHSFLPAFVGAKPYHQAFHRGVKVIGATSHFVSDQLDEGPIIMQQVIPMDHSYTPHDLARAGRDIERTVLANSLKLLNEDRVFLCANRTIIFD